MKVYLVGGAVRDALLNYPVVEHDYVVVGSTPEEMQSLGYKQVGKDFPVFLHPQSKDEYALARKERKNGQGYTGFICDFDPTVTLEEDLYRRDLTINAMAQDESGQLVDPYHGQTDINNRLLRHVGPAFSEDPLRVLRVARFAARYQHLDFTIAPETLLLMKDMVASGELKTLTKERIWLEIEKCLKTNSLHLFLDVLNEIGALADVLPILPIWSKSQSKKVTNANVNLANLETNINSEQLSIYQFCLCLEHSNPQELKQIEQTLKIPSIYANALRDHKLLQQFLLTEHPTAKDILDFFNQIDLWRRPERLNLLIEILKYTQSHDQITQTLQECASITQTITAQQMIALGFQGAAIKTGLETTRIHAIEKWLS